MLSQLDFKSESQMLWGAVVQAGLSQALDVLELRAAFLLQKCSPLHCWTCQVAIAVPFLACTTSVPAQPSGAKMGDVMLEITWPPLC